MIFQICVKIGLKAACVEQWIDKRLEAQKTMSDYILIAPPADSISEIHFSPRSDEELLLVSSWDSTTRLYDIYHNCPKATYAFDGAVLSCCFNADGSNAYAAGLDQAIHRVDLQRSTKTILYQHEGPVARIINHDHSNLL